MKRTHWAMCLWPGLPQLWQSGSWSALLVAIAFTVLLNLLIVSTFVWSELIGAQARIIITATIVLAWLLSLAVSIGWLRKFSRENQAESIGDLFSAAVDEYLMRNWFAAETLLGQILVKDNQDAEARLMLATLKRHIGQHDEAQNELQRLSRQENAEKWRYEIQQEQILIEDELTDQLESDHSDLTDHDDENDNSEQNQTVTATAAGSKEELSDIAADDQQNGQINAA